MAYRSIQEQWMREIAQVAARAKRAEDRKAERKAIEELPTMSQRILGRLMWRLRK